MRDRTDRPRTTPLRSASLMVYHWWKSPFGTAEKPGHVKDIPWGYVEDHQDEIPFLGLREYWSPAVQSRQLRNNRAKAVQILGDYLVFFRDEDERARALENRCPHRGALPPRGRVGALAPGTITCRYHGMAFDGDGECVALIADGRPAGGCAAVSTRALIIKIQARARPVCERKDSSSSLATDLGHGGTLHRTCALFADQKPYGQIRVEEVDRRGRRAYYEHPGQHAGPQSLDQIFWYLPHLVYHAPGDVTPFTEGWFWFVPRDVGSFSAWLKMGLPTGNGLMTAAFRRLVNPAFGTPLLRNVPGSDCIYGGDGPVQASQGRVVRWDQERRTRPDRAVTRVRRTLKQGHAQEVAERQARNRELRPGSRSEQRESTRHWPAGADRPASGSIA